MRQRIGLLTVAVVLGVSLSAVPALAVNEFCDTVTATECQVTTLHNLGAGGTFTVDRVLHIIGPLGELRTNPNTTLTLNIAGGSPNGLIIDSGGKITGNAATAAQIGATININVTTGNILLAASGATISAAHTATIGCGPPLPGKGGVINITANGTNAKIITEVGTTISVNGGALPSLGGCPAGAINISAPNRGEINIDGNVLAESTQTGTGNNQRPGGGPINIIAGCGLTISDTGVVSSKGKDPGADRVHLEGCFVTINGLVQSTGDGHTIPNNPPNHCNNNAGAGGGDRPDKPENSTACIEIWSGTTVTINSITHNGQVNADIGLTGGGSGRSWIDIYANGTINIVGDNTGPFSVHANMSVAGIAGIITTKSLAGDVVASGLAIQADNIAAGGDGGVVKVQAKNNVNFTGASIFARGDFDATGGFGVGGVLGPLAPVSEPIRAFTGSLSWTTGVGDVRPTGSAVPVAQRGQINLQACNAAGGVTLGASFPVNGAVVPPFPNILASSCVGDPTKPAYVILPLATCINQCGLPSKKKGTKFNDLNDSKTKDPGEPGLPNWEIRVFDAANMLVASQFTNASGNYEFNLAPGSYKVCEVLQGGWTQTCPTAGGLDCNGVATTIANCAALGAGLGPVGYAITLAPGQTDEGNDFGNNQTAKKKGMKFNDLNGNHVKDPTDPGLPNWEIRVFDAANTQVASAFTNASGNYEFNLAPGSYKVCEVLQVGWTQTCPTAGGLDCNGVATTIANCTALGADLAPLGYAITLTSGQTDEGNDFGNQFGVPCVGINCDFCELGSVKVALNPATGQFPGNLGPDVVVDARVSSIQAAINSASDLNGDGYIIIGVIAMDNKQPGGTVTQSINISQFYPAPFALIACGVTLRDSDTCDTVGPIVITASGGGTGFPPPLGPSFNVYVQDFTAINTFSAPGWLVLGTGRYLENPGATGDSVGIKVVGNGNVIHNGLAKQNFQQGILVQGNGNTIDGVVANKNGLEGIKVVGDNNDVLNSLAGDAGAGNNKDGINVSGKGNTVSGNSAFANKDNGIAVSGGIAGNPNVVEGNQAGAVGKGNKGNGIVVNGAGNGAALPIEIEGNTTKSNSKAGIRIQSGTNNQLKDNVSGGVTAAEDNGGCEYQLASGNIDGGGNVANGVVVPLTGCTGSP